MIVLPIFSEKKKLILSSYISCMNKVVLLINVVNNEVFSLKPKNTAHCLIHYLTKSDTQIYSLELCVNF